MTERTRGVFPAIVGGSAAILAALLASLATAAFMGVYGYLMVIAPFVGKVSIAACIGSSYSSGRVTAAVIAPLTRAKSTVARGGSVVIPFLQMAWAVYVAWVVWTYALLRELGTPVGLVNLATRPGFLWKLVCAINKRGAWYVPLGDIEIRPVGWHLWVMWVVEVVATVVALLAGVAMGLEENERRRSAPNRDSPS